jgi:hypothetical protein
VTRGDGCGKSQIGQPLVCVRRRPSCLTNLRQRFEHSHTPSTRGAFGNFSAILILVVWNKAPDFIDGGMANDRTAGRVGDLQDCLVRHLFPIGQFPTDFLIDQIESMLGFAGRLRTEIVGVQLADPRPPAPIADIGFRLVAVLHATAPQVPNYS